MKKKYTSILLILMSMSMIVNAGTPVTGNTPEKKKAIDLSNFDTTVNPRNDFYNYVNGNWLKNNPIPPTENLWGSFNELREKNLKNMRIVLDEAAADKSAPQGSNKQKIRDFYSTGMDSLKREKEGAAPLKDIFAKIAAIKNSDDLVNVIGYLHTIQVRNLFGFSVDQDDKASTEMICKLHQGGIGLPDRDYYFNTDDNSKMIQKEYKNYISMMFGLLGDSPLDVMNESASIINIETDLAKASRKRVDLRDPELNYNKKTIAELKTLVPNMNWDNFFKAVGVNITTIVVGQPDFFVEVNTLLKSISIGDWKNYLRYKVINTFAGDLSTAFVNQSFHFYGTILSGTKEIKPLWKRCLEATDGELGEALGKLYVDKFFSAQAKQRVNTMVDNLIAAYKERINKLDWMSSETKQKAIEKLNLVMKKLAYPDKWKDYSNMDIKNDSYVLNAIRANTFDYKREINKLGKPIDRTEWGMSPPTVNAYYNPAMNEIVFPAGIMQSPFFDAGADDAVNYGSMGAVIGHELTHGFDDQGCQYDAQGNLKNWWTEDDKTKFKAKTEILAKQFDQYVAIDSLHVNGHLTLGENLADLGGLTIAYYAYKKALADGTAKNEKIDGFTGEQRFFISWAQGWRTNFRPESLRKQVKTNPHSPGNFRVLGPLSNMPEFYAAFNVKQGDKMWRPENERAIIW